MLNEIFPVKKKIKNKKYDFVGPICESADIFIKNNPSQILKKDDLIVICSVGAYGASMSSEYNFKREILRKYLLRKIKL